MNVTPAAIPEVLVIDPQVHRDERGFFLETYHEEKYRRAGIRATFVQDNHSRSEHGTLRGLHAQFDPAQDKLVRCVRGEIFDVAVDARVGSPTFGQWMGETLSAQNFRQLWIPVGFLHGFAVVSEEAEVEYKVTGLYRPEGELGVAWNDPAIGVSWPSDTPTLSGRDQDAPLLSEVMDRLPRF